MTESGVISKTALVYGQMNEPPGARLRVGLTGLTMAEYFRDEQGQDVLLFIDNIFRFTQAGSEVSALLGRMPSAVGYQPTLATEMGSAPGAHHVDDARLDHLGAGDLRARRRPHRPGAGRDLRPPRRDDRALACDLGEGHLSGRRPARLDVAHPAAGRRRRAPLLRRDAGPEGPPAIQGPAGHHRDPGHGRALRRGQGHRAARPQDRALPVPAVLRREPSSPAATASTSSSRTRSAASRRSSRASTTSCPSRPSTWQARSIRSSPRRRR